MSVSTDSTALSTIDDGRAVLSSTFLDFCVKVRKDDPSILPEPGQPFNIRRMSEREGIELADALLENTSVTDLELDTKDSAEAMAKYVRTSKYLQRINWVGAYQRSLQGEDIIICCLLLAIQESTSLKVLNMELPFPGRPSYLALENMLTYTQTVQSLSLHIPPGHIDVTAISSGLKKNTTLRELTLRFSYDNPQGATDVSHILTRLCDHPLLRRLCLRGPVVDLTGLEALLLSDTSKITELEINRSSASLLIIGIKSVLRALARRPTLTKLMLRAVRLDRDEGRELAVFLCKNPNLQTLVLRKGTLGRARLAELAPALYRNTSIKVLDISDNALNDMESAELLRDIIRRNKTMTTLNLSANAFGQTTGAVECIAEGLGSNSTLLKIDLSRCCLRDAGASTLVRSLGSRNTTLQKLTIDWNGIASTGLGALLENMEQSSHITDLDLRHNPIWNEGANLLARSLGNNALPNLTRLSLFECRIGDDGFIALMSALEQNTTLLQLDLRSNRHYFSERVYLALAESLPDIKVLQQLEIDWCEGLASAMPLLLVGLRENTSLFRIHVANWASRFLPPTPVETARYAGGWMQEIEYLGYRNSFRTLIRAPEETLPPRGVWPYAFARVATLPDVILEVLRSKSSLVPSEDAGGKEVAKDTGVPSKRKRGEDANMP
jgi:hypothetical protein